MDEHGREESLKLLSNIEQRILLRQVTSFVV